MMIRIQTMKAPDHSTSERYRNGFHLNEPHLKRVLAAKAELKAKGYSEEWMDAQRTFHPKLMVKTVKPC